MKQIAVTGAAGFIGSHLVDRLLQLGHRVIALDNLSYGLRDNLASALTNPRFEFVEGDVQIAEQVAPVVSRCELVYHLAAFKIPRYSDAVDTLLVNALGSKAVLDACVKKRIPIIAASTSDVYGMNPSIPFTEESTSVIGPPTVRRWAYAVSKMYEEQLCFAYRERHKIPATLVRFFGGYGPRQNLTWWGGPQSVFINQALRGEALEVHGDGTQTRSFTYIADHVEALVSLIDNPKVDGQVLNFGCSDEIQIVELARKIWRLIRTDEPKIRLVPYATFGKYQDVMRRVPDASKCRDLCGVEFRTMLSDGLTRTIAWQKQVLGL